MLYGILGMIGCLLLLVSTGGFVLGSLGTVMGLGTFVFNKDEREQDTLLFVGICLLILFLSLGFIYLREHFVETNNYIEYNVATITNVESYQGRTSGRFNAYYNFVLNNGDSFSIKAKDSNVEFEDVDEIEIVYDENKSKNEFIEVLFLTHEDIPRYHYNITLPNKYK